MRKLNKVTAGILCIAFVFMLVIGLRFNNTANNEMEEAMLIVEENLIEETGLEDIGVLEEQGEDEVDKKNVEATTEEGSLQTQATVTGEDTANNGGTYPQAPAVVAETSVDRSRITGETYTVKSGDSLFFIAQRASISLNHLKALNGLNGDTIYVGQVLKTKGTVEPITVAAATTPASTTQSVTRGATREDEIYWLSRIIHAEAQGEPYRGKVAVGNVILNRVKDSNFPNTIYGVVFDRQYGYTQFSPVLDGSIYNKPNADSVRAAQEVLNGARPVGEALYFLNPRKATNFWIPQNRRFMMTIGDHDFYY